MLNALIGSHFAAGIMYGLFVDSTYLKLFFAIFIPYTVITQFFIRDLKDHTKRKGTQISSWGHPSDPSAYINVDFHTGEARKYTEKINENVKDDPNRKVTFNHVMIKAIAWGAWKYRKNWGRIVFGFFRPLKEMGITVLCDAGGKDLVPVTIWNAHEMTLEEIAIYLNEKIIKAKSFQDKEFKETTKLFGIIPTFILTPIMHIVAYTAANLGFNLPGFGENTRKLGHIVITNVGSMDFDMAFAPLCSPMFAQCMLCVGKIFKKPYYDEGQEKVLAKETTQCVFTMDHRYGDAANIAPTIKVMQDYINNPEDFDPSKYKDVVSKTELERGAAK